MKTFIVAEIGINHGGDLLLAKEMVEKAVRYGADAVKFQTYKTEQRVTKEDKLFPILKECELSKDDHIELAKEAKKHDIIFFSTPFDVESLKMLESMKVPLIKISSFDVTNLKFLKQIAKTRIPVIMSTGMANRNEIDRAVQIFEKNSVECSLLHCVSAYPVCNEDLNLRTIRALGNIFCCRVGYSDHSGDKDVPPIAVAMGAEIIEMHFATYRNYGIKAPDAKVSLFDDDFTEAVGMIRKVETMLGSGELKQSKVEKDTLKYRRFSSD